MAEDRLQWVVEAVDKASETLKKISGLVSGLNKELKKMQEGTSASVDPKMAEHALTTEGAIARLNKVFKYLGVQLETIDYYFISGFKLYSLYKLIETVKSAVMGAEKYKNTLNGIVELTRYYGESSTVAFDGLTKLAADGLIGIDKLAEGYRNLLGAQLKSSEALQLLQAIKVTGVAFGTQGSLSLEQAMVGVTQGILEERSAMLDQTNVVENLDQIYKKYAETHGLIRRVVTASGKVHTTLGEELTRHQRSLAVLEFFLEKAARGQGAYDKALKGLTGNLGELSKEWKNTLLVIGASIGESITPAIGWLTKLVKLIQDGVIEMNKFGYSVMYVSQLVQEYAQEKTTTVGSWWDKVKTFFSRSPLENWKAYTSPRTAPKEDWSLPSAGEDWSLSSSTPNAMPLQEKIAYMYNQYTEMMKKIEEQFKKPLGDMIPITPGGGENPLVAEDRINKATEALEKYKAILKEVQKRGGERIAEAFTTPIQRGFSDALTNLFTGEKSESIIEMARNFAKSLARAISDAFAEALFSPIKSQLSTFFTGMLRGIGWGTGQASTLAAGQGLDAGLSSTISTVAASANQVSVYIGGNGTPEEIGKAVEYKLRQSYQSHGQLRRYIKGGK